ncbi:MAG: hypothetical protein JXA92_05700 [candidate division Zixibacteria bacterium]|nr:hypothetical protein [candidate division Zixibacteria bacterium]
MTSTSRNLGIIFLSAVIARLAFNYLTGFMADDAFITFRYAENIAAGNGFVYNIGEKVLGTSTPFFTFILSVFAVLSISVPTAALFVSLIASGLTAVVLFRFAQLLRFSHFIALPAVCYALWPRSIPTDACGMETAFFTLLIISAFYFQHKQLRLYAVGMATLAAVTRPEGLGLLILLTAYNFFSDRQRRWSYIIIPAIILVPWLALSTLYFGTPIPNSITAKLALYSRFGDTSFWDKLAYLMGWHKYYGYPLLLAALFGSRWLIKKQNFGRLEVIWMVGTVLFYLFSRTRVFFWYIVPVFPVYFIFIMAAVPYFFDKINYPAHKQKTAAVLLTLLMAAVLLAGNYQPVIRHRESRDFYTNIHQQIGYYLYSHTNKNDLVAAEDIGYMGYYSKRRILDRDGLVSPEAIPYNREGRYRDLIIDRKPDWLVCAIGSPMSAFVEDSVFTARYQTERTFTFDIFQYIVYSRIKHK